MIAYMSNCFPLLSETFIYREAFELRRRGLIFQLYSIRRPDPAKLSAEAQTLLHETTYLLPIPFGRLLTVHASVFVKNPVRYVMTLFALLGGTYRTLRDRLRGLLHFGEGVVLAQIMKRDGITHIHANFASQSTSVARVVNMINAITYSFTGHAHDIWLDQLQIPQKLKEAQFVCCCSALGKKWLCSQARSPVEDKVHVVYHGIDVRHFVLPQPTVKRNDDVLLAVGRLTEQKGFEDLLTACAVLRDRGIALRVWFVGDGELRKELTDRAAALHLDDRVVFWGAQPQEKIMEFYHTATLFVLPCVDTRDGNRDGIPNVLLEAMACGLPVVTTTNAGQAELIDNEKNGILLAPHQPDQLAHALSQLLTDPARRESLATEARRTVVQRFDSQKSVEPFWALLKRFA